MTVSENRTTYVYTKEKIFDTKRQRLSKKSDKLLRPTKVCRLSTEYLNPLEIQNISNKKGSGFLSLS